MVKAMAVTLKKHSYRALRARLEIRSLLTAATLTVGKVMLYRDSGRANPNGSRTLQALNVPFSADKDSRFDMEGLREMDNWQVGTAHAVLDTDQERCVPLDDARSN